MSADDWTELTGGLTPETMAADHERGMAASREWQEREQAAIRWVHEDAASDPRGTGATVLLMLRERTTSESRMAKMLYGAAEEFDALAEDTCGAEPESRFRELAARCREAAS